MAQNGIVNNNAVLKYQNLFYVAAFNSPTAIFSLYNTEG